jgi:hypothetical protein
VSQATGIGASGEANIVGNDIIVDAVDVERTNGISIGNEVVTIPSDVIIRDNTVSSGGSVGVRLHPGTVARLEELRIADSRTGLLVTEAEASGHDVFIEAATREAVSLDNSDLSLIGLHVSDTDVGLNAEDSTVELSHSSILTDAVALSTLRSNVFIDSSWLRSSVVPTIEFEGLTPPPPSSAFATLRLVHSLIEVERREPVPIMIMRAESLMWFINSGLDGSIVLALAPSVGVRCVEAWGSGFLGDQCLPEFRIPPGVVPPP